MSENIALIDSQTVDPNVNERNELVSKLESTIKELRLQNFELESQIDKYKEENEYLQRVAKEAKPYIDNYNEIKKLSLEVWDPMINISLELKKHNPRLYHEFLMQYKARKAEKLK